MGTYEFVKESGTSSREPIHGSLPTPANHVTMI